VELGAYIWEFLAGCIRSIALAKFEEVVAGFGSVLWEQFDNDLLHITVDVQIEVCILAARGVVDQGAVGVGGALLVDDGAGLVDEAELIQGPFDKGLRITDVNDIVEVDDGGWGLVMEEGALLLKL